MMEELNRIKSELASMKEKLTEIEGLKKENRLLSERLALAEKKVTEHRHLQYDGTSQLFNPSMLGLKDAFVAADTDGYPLIPSVAGAPTGVPGYKGGTGVGIALIYDRSNNKIYAYNGGWVSVTLA